MIARRAHALTTPQKVSVGEHRKQRHLPLRRSGVFNARIHCRARCGAALDVFRGDLSGHVRGRRDVSDSGAAVVQRNGRIVQSRLRSPRVGEPGLRRGRRDDRRLFAGTRLCARRFVVRDHRLGGATSAAGSDGGAFDLPGRDRQTADAYRRLGPLDGRLDYRSPRAAESRGLRRSHADVRRRLRRRGILEHAVG